MTAEVNVDVSGLEETKRALNAFAGDLRKTVRASLRKSARPVVVQAKANAPVLKRPVRRRVAGTLKKNIKAINSKKANGSGGRIGVYVSVKASRKDLKKAPITGDPYYWRWVEGGHRVVARGKRIGTRFGKARYDTTLRERRRASRRFIAAREFLLQAYRTKGREVVGLFVDDVLARIHKFNSTR